MKRYIYIIIGIVVVAVIAIIALFLIKNNSGAAPSTGTTGTTPAGSLPTTGTQGTGTGAGTSGSGTQGGSTPPASIGLPSLNPSSTPTTGATGQMTVQNFGVLSSDPVLDYFIDARNNITAIEPTGEVIAVSGGQSVVVNSSTIANIISASFSYDGKKIVVSYGDPTNPNGGIFDTMTNVWTALPQGMLSPQWSPINNYQIAYFVATGNGKLALATINAASLKTAPAILFSLSANDLTLQWPTKAEFIISDKPTSQNAGSIWAFNSQAGTLLPLIYEATGAEGIWSRDAAIPYGLAFFNSPSGQSNVLQLMPYLGNLPTQTFTLQTLPSKCAFNPEQMPTATSTPAVATSTATSTTSSTKKVPASPKTPTSTPYLALYCGVPRSTSGFSSATLPDSYNMMALFTSDDVYKINTVTGESEPLWSDNTQNVDLSDVKFFNNALFFVNRYDQKLYGLTFTSN